jgi:hypothetical protein
MQNVLDASVQGLRDLVMGRDVMGRDDSDETP